MESRLTDLRSRSSIRAIRVLRAFRFCQGLRLPLGDPGIADGVLPESQNITNDERFFGAAGILQNTWWSTDR